MCQEEAGGTPANGNVTESVRRSQLKLLSLEVQNKARSVNLQHSRPDYTNTKIPRRISFVAAGRQTER